MNLVKIPSSIFIVPFYVGLSTPEVVFEGSSSNRSTAVVQLDSKSSGRVLLQDYIQMEEVDFVQEIIDWLLLLGNYEKGSGRIVFKDKTEVQEKENDENPITNENDNVSTSKPLDGLKMIIFRMRRCV